MSNITFGTATGTNLYTTVLDSGTHTPTTDRTYDIGSSTKFWKTAFTDALRSSSTQGYLAIGNGSSADQVRISTSAIYPTTTLSHNLGTSSNNFSEVHGRSLYGSSTQLKMFIDDGSTDYAQLISSAGNNSFSPNSESSRYSLGYPSTRWPAVYGQKFGNTSVASCACLDLTGSTTTGLLPPKLTGAQITGVSSPVEGVTLHSTESNCPIYYNGHKWMNTISPVLDSVYLDSATTFSETSSGADFSGSPYVAFTTPSTNGWVKFRFLASSLTPSSTNTVYIGASTTSGSLSHSSWEVVLCNTNPGANTSIPCNLENVLGLTANTSYVFYLKLGTSSGTASVRSGGTTGEGPRGRFWVESFAW